ncbi:MAG: phosphoribosylamine--glycine ligase [Bacteroidales bacterium]
MNVLLIGSGGRESAMAWKISQSNILNKLFIAPGNAGTNEYGTNVKIKETDFDSLAKLCLQESIKLIIIGPELPLAEGIVNFFSENNDLKDIKILGPSKEAAQLESSKDFAKEFMTKHSIPTAKYQTFNAEQFDEAIEFLRSMNPPYVLKADGLAAGKGVVIPNTIEEATEVLKNMLFDGQFGAAGNKVVIEEFLSGIELSVFVVTDGENYVILPEAKDYKCIGEGDSGPNTGGMGSVSPVPFADANFMQKVEDEIIKPTIMGLQKDGIKYCGFIFFGLIKVGDEAFVIEYNARLGDPETESVMPRIESDFLDLCLKTVNSDLHDYKIEISSKYAASVFMVSGGYPGDYEKGYEISGLENIKESIIFHAGTSLSDDNKIVSSGGRVLAVSSLDETMDGALKKSYNSIEKIKFKNSSFRKDIGFDL